MSITVIGWLLSPILAFLVNKLFSYLSVDVERKLNELETITIPNLKETLMDVQEQIILRAEKGQGYDSDMLALDKMKKELKYALYDAEDILDIVNYHQIETVIGNSEPQGSSSQPDAAPQRYRDVIGDFICRCRGFLFERCLGITQSAQRWGRRTPGSILPIRGTSFISRFQRLGNRSRHLIRSLSNSYQSLLILLFSAVAAARVYRDRSYEVVGIESEQVLSHPVEEF